MWLSIIHKLKNKRQNKRDKHHLIQRDGLPRAKPLASCVACSAPHVGKTVFEYSVMADIDVILKVLFLQGQEKDVYVSTCKQKGAVDVNATEWSPSPQGPGSEQTRKVTYSIQYSNALLGTLNTPCFEEQTVKLNLDRQSFVVDTIIRTPEVTYGSTFYAQQRLCAKWVNNHTHIQVTASFVFTKRLFLQGTIESLAIGGMKEFYGTLQRVLEMKLIERASSLQPVLESDETLIDLNRDIRYGDLDVKKTAQAKFPPHVPGTQASCSCIRCIAGINSAEFASSSKTSRISLAPAAEGIPAFPAPPPRKGSRIHVIDSTTFRPPVPQKQVVDDEIPKKDESPTDAYYETREDVHANVGKSSQTAFETETVLDQELQRTKLPSAWVLHPYTPKSLSKSHYKLQQPAIIVRVFAAVFLPLFLANQIGMLGIFSSSLHVVRLFIQGIIFALQFIVN